LKRPGKGRPKDPEEEVHSLLIGASIAVNGDIGLTNAIGDPVEEMEEEMEEEEDECVLC